jgi:hypothetical protein
VTVPSDRNDESGFNLLLTFDSDEPEFARGFEAGRLWERIKNDRTSWDEVVHGSNAEMVMRMCEVQEREFRAEPMDDEFVQVWVA